jgi:hypothetical protein
MPGGGVETLAALDRVPAGPAVLPQVQVFRSCPLRQHQLLLHLQLQPRPQMQPRAAEMPRQLAGQRAMACRHPVPHHLIFAATPHAAPHPWPAATPFLIPAARPLVRRVRLRRDDAAAALDLD